MRIFYGSFASNVDDFFDAIFSAGNRQKVTLAHTRRSLKSTFISPAHNFTNTMTLSHNFTKKMIHFHDFTNKIIYPHNFTKKVLHSHNFTKKMTHSHNFTNTMTHSHSFTNTVTHSHNFNKLDKSWHGRKALCTGQMGPHCPILKQDGICMMHPPICQMSLF